MKGHLKHMKNKGNCYLYLEKVTYIGRCDEHSTGRKNKVKR